MAKITLVTQDAGAPRRRQHYFFGICAPVPGGVQVHEKTLKELMEDYLPAYLFSFLDPSQGRIEGLCLQELGGKRWKPFFRPKYSFPVGLRTFKDI